MNVKFNLSPEELIDSAVKCGEGQLTKDGALLVKTNCTGRSPNDRFIVINKETEKKIEWNKSNRSIGEHQYHSLKREIQKYICSKDFFLKQASVCANRQYKMPLTVVTETAYHNLFADYMFRPRFQNRNCTDYIEVFHAPGFKVFNPEKYGLNSENFIVLHPEEKVILIGGTEYCGEMKKAVFTLMNYVLPQKDVLSMHCSANTDLNGKNTTLMFGLSGTGKTTLSADVSRSLVGDDEHGWGPNGIFNLEGGCYAKVIDLSLQGEPQIYRCTHTKGTILENVVINNKGIINLDNDSITKNTRASYPLDYIDGIVSSGCADHPRNIIFLTCDALGILPPVAQLNYEQAVYYFLSGYTAKVAGTEKELGNKPQATFSVCFGGPFMVLSPNVYADLFYKKDREYQLNCWLVNTGWSGGSYGTGKRVGIDFSHAIVKNINNGSLAGITKKPDPFFDFMVPEFCPDVPTEVLDTRNTWDDKDAYDRQAKELVEKFKENFKKFNVADEIKKAGPR